MLSMSQLNVIILSILIVSFVIWADGEVYTSTHEMEYLLETQQRVVQELDAYISTEEQRLNDLKRHLDIFKREQKKAMVDPVNYVGSPINAFTLIKRLTYDLKEIETNIKVGIEYINNVTLRDHDVMYPTQEDLTGAAIALSRLQQTYQLETDDLAEGKLKGVTYSTPLNAGDCFELGKALYREKIYKEALEWMTVALRKYEMEQITYNFTEENIFDFIANTKYVLGDIKSALEWTKKLLILNPSHKRASVNIPYLNKLISVEENDLKRRRRGDTGEEIVEVRVEPASTMTYAYHFTIYEKLCRGESNLLPSISKTLSCQYLTGEHPFLRYAAIKMEYLYRDPDIVMYYDVLSDNEIDFIQNLAKPNLQRATVGDESVSAHYRISKTAWLKDETSPVVARVSRRVADFTNLDLNTSEDLQVANYGIGGHNVPHFDHARSHESPFSSEEGNRIATVLFYMSDVAQGGATVFTELGLCVFPVKGAAVFWMNLHRSGAEDLATRHAACPVLLGSKWVCNKWIHEVGQELVRPCSLEYQPENMHLKLSRGVPKSFR
ncbi:prolyl 4-hydroxylase subunit alpha-1-like [Leptidea sinapis]|uniref:prolyl 4-hydroxylase subunit alpha-1-like n=1 Tax=Leptidea sinapis TaxID=189913 RepID=UPI0021343AE9|nr:prolyl 4-hydroxylase subunit alpha-1-like [Leptidea sinapis]XP_050664943.1 prolyl 4-hydroxylase subunit alpha-1-like [Leptidea sinapis]